MTSTSECSSCGSQVNPSAKFCRNCGAALEATNVEATPPVGAERVDPKPGVCRACSAPVAPGAAFCRSCGERQPEGAKEGPRTAQPPPPPPPPKAPPPPPPGVRAGHPQPLAPPPSSGGRGPLVALAAVAACLALGGLVFGGVYLLARDDPDATEAVSSFPQASGSSLDEDLTEEGKSFESLDEGNLSPIERGFPSDSKPAMRAEAEEMLREFHVALVERDFQYAWSLLSARKRRKEEQEKAYAGWKEAQSTLTPYLLPDGIRVEIDGLEDDGVARVLVTGMGWTAPGSPCSEWSGLTWVRYEGGAWHYDPGYSTTAERRRDWEDRSGELMGVGC